MAHDQASTSPGRTCPTCGEPLEREGELLRCAQHGLFFSYGPRLLVHVPRPDAAEQPLMPWQTLAERAVR